MEMDKGHKIDVLDHGYVKLIDWLGSDADIVAAARMSTGRGFVSWEPYRRCKRCEGVAASVNDNAYPCRDDEGRLVLDGHDWQDFPRGDIGLLEFMYKNGHSSPFEFAELHVEVQAPIFVFREWMRHRTFSFSEMSARYTQMPDLHYVPLSERITKQSTVNRQGSGEVFNPAHAESIVDRLVEDQQRVYEHYEGLIEDGVAKEIARINTPVSRYSRMRAKTDLRNWLAFLKLRMASNAQWEIQEYARAVAEMVKALFPRTYALFEDHTLGSVSFSKSEIAWFHNYFRVRGVRNLFDIKEPDKGLLAKIGVKDY